VPFSKTLSAGDPNRCQCAPLERCFAVSSLASALGRSADILVLLGHASFMFGAAFIGGFSTFVLVMASLHRSVTHRPAIHRPVAPSARRTPKRSAPEV
jgi:hypothetical protein